MMRANRREALFHKPRIHPAVAAAVLVLGSKPVHPLVPALRVVAPHLTEAEQASWITALLTPLHKAGITTPRRMAAFLGQCAVESGGFRSLQEDLTYSATRLCQVWPTRFPNKEVAEACAHQPEALANTVYANRLGNGGPDSGDGWQFRGRGLIQITGRTSYERFATAMNMTLDQAVEHAATQAGAADSAAWFWSTNGLNALAETWSLDILTRTINGGTLGADERAQLCDAALHAIGV